MPKRRKKREGRKKNPGKGKDTQKVSPSKTAHLKRERKAQNVMPGQRQEKRSEAVKNKKLKKKAPP